MITFANCFQFQQFTMTLTFMHIYLNPYAWSVGSENLGKQYLKNQKNLLFNQHPASLNVMSVSLGHCARNTFHFYFLKTCCYYSFDQVKQTLLT